MTWQSDDEIARLKAENDALRKELVAVKRVMHNVKAHIYEGCCPDEQQPDARDVNCWACSQMMTEAEKSEAWRRVRAGMDEKH